MTGACTVLGSALGVSIRGSGNYVWGLYTPRYKIEDFQINVANFSH